MATNTFGFQDGSKYDISGSQLVGPNSASSMPVTSGLQDMVQANVSPVIPVDAIKPVTPLINGLPLPEEVPDNIAAIANGVNEYSKSLDQYIKDLTPSTTPLQQERNGIMDRIKSLLPQTEGKGQAILQAEAASGIPEQQKQLASLNAQIKTRYAEFQKEQASLGVNESMSRGSYIGRDAAIRRQGIAELSLLEARAQGLQGEISAQQNSIDRAVGLLFADQEQKLTNLERQMNFIKPMLDEEQATLAIAREQKIRAEREAIAEEKAKRKENLNLAFSTNTNSKFANRGGEIFRVSDGKSYATPEEFFADAGVRSFEDAYARGLVRDISQNTVDERNFVMQAATKYPDAGILPSDSVEVATTKLQNSASYQKDIYQDETYTLSSGQVRYDKDGNIIAVGPEDKASTTPSIVKIDGKDYILDGNGQFVPASNFITGNETMTQEAVTKASEVKKLIDDMLDDDLTNAVGPISNKLPALTGKKTDFEAKFARLQALLTVDNLSLLKGPMSDKDIQFLKETGTALKLNMSEKTFTEELKSLQNKFAEKLGNTGTTEKPVGPPPLGEMWVKEKSTGKWGALPVNEYDPNKYESLTKAGNASASTSGKSLASVVVNKFKDGTVGGQCGDYARKVANTLGLDYPRVGNSLKEKINTVKKYGTSVAGAKVGSVIVTKENPTYGHVAVIVGRNDKGYIVTESNFKQSNKISTGRVIPYNSKLIVGVINPTPKA